jgi:hypothetical protein
LPKQSRPESSGRTRTDSAWRPFVGISLNNLDAYQEVVRTSDVQIFLDQAKVNGDVHYLIERPSYPRRADSITPT